jgi:hypothetical protein
VAFAFRKEKEKTVHSGDDGQRNRLPNPQAGVLPVADGGYLRIKQAKVSCGKFAFIDCFGRFVVESQMGLVGGIESSGISLFVRDQVVDRFPPHLGGPCKAPK